jgi:activating signal cointegrator 1
VNTIYTYGYQGSTPEQLLGTVNDLGAVLVDIRYSPWSPNPHWRKLALAELVGANRYQWIQDLGNVNYKSGGPIRLLRPEAAAVRLREVLDHRSIVLLCACRDWETCHRRDAAEYLSEALQAPVEHLSPDTGSLGENTMRALSLTQPWASLVAIGAKTWETRSWQTAYRGPIAIHAAKAFPQDARRLCLTEPFTRVLVAAGIRLLSGQPPLGAVVATATLVDCVRTEVVRDSLTPEERAFGDYGDGRWAWKFEDVARLPQPIPAKGALGLWRWER